MSYRVPFVDAKVHYARIKPEVDEAILSCLERGQLIYRQELKDFERALAKFVGVKYAVGLNSGYHALLFALQGADIGHGDEVIVPAHTFVASVSAIVHCGAKPVLVDVGADYNLDVAKMAKAVTKRTRAVMPVHLNGRLCDMDAVAALARKHRLKIVEDAAQSLGATFRGRKAGSFGDAGCFSFYPFKVLGGFGDGGAITTNDPKITRAASLLRYNGEDRETGEYHYHGQTALLDNIQAAVLNVKLKKLPGWIRHRQAVAQAYRRGLQDIPQLTLPHFEDSRFMDIYQNYVISCRQRDKLRAHLRQDGIETLVHWMKPMWEHKALQLRAPEATETKRICKEVISLPMSAETPLEHVAQTVASIRRFYKR